MTEPGPKFMPSDAKACALSQESGNGPWKKRKSRQKKNSQESWEPVNFYIPCTS